MMYITFMIPIFNIIIERIPWKGSSLFEYLLKEAWFSWRIGFVNGQEVIFGKNKVIVLDNSTFTRTQDLRIPNVTRLFILSFDYLKSTL